MMSPEAVALRGAGMLDRLRSLDYGLYNALQLMARVMHDKSLEELVSADPCKVVSLVESYLREYCELYVYLLVKEGAVREEDCHCGCVEVG